MQRVCAQSFFSRLEAFDQAVLQTPDIDHFCSASPWAISAMETLSDDHELLALRAEHVDGWAALSRSTHPRVGHYLQPLEASWGLCAPFIGAHPEKLIREFAHWARAESASWRLLFLTGIVEGSAQFTSLIRHFRDDHLIGLGPRMQRMSASLEGGFEGFLSRRSSKFRANMRRARRIAETRAVSHQYLHHFSSTQQVQQTFERVLAIERESWKGAADAGICTTPMRDFYERMLPRLAQRDALRVVFTRVDDADIAYCVGGLTGLTYRGLQMSFDRAHRDLSAGNLVQLAMIEHLCDEGILAYDMGQAMDYKSRWTDDTFETVALMVRS